MLLAVDEEFVIQWSCFWLYTGLKMLLTVDEVCDTIVILLVLFRVKYAVDGG